MMNKQEYLDLMKTKIINFMYAVVYVSAIVVMFLDAMYWRPH